MPRRYGHPFHILSAWSNSFRLYLLKYSNEASAVVHFSNLRDHRSIPPVPSWVHNQVQEALSADADFGQSDFGHPYWPTLANSDFGQKHLTDFDHPDLTDFGQTDLIGVSVFWPSFPKK